ncbi:ABC transporter ATP-binding protein [Brevibacillus fluminis]|uniref:ABC transporter ATP-binding protein n=1 Tax=Brevibacillus fluminis TaxID=511487 RepID=A0A3M8D6C8_9BACL|nr:ABC transporter ATP-binding protein [Brevibacillus fluminis]RNB83373.1 ABC transporter ATP-binding protein [Brevibacillus fluminis]
MIAFHQVTKSFPINGSMLPIVKVKHWTVEAGERVALIGPSGSGKSTLLHLASGVLPVDSGEITVADHPIHRYSEGQRDRYRAQMIGYIFQDFHLISSLSARQNVELVLPPAWTKQQRREEVDRWFELVGLQDRQKHLPAQLSRGQQQRVAMIRALIGNAPLILADEPTGSLDWETAGEVMSLLLSLCESEKRTLLTVTHDLHLARLFPKTVHISELNELVRKTNEAESSADSKGERVG